MKALLGTKLGMTQLFDESGNVQAVTIVAAGPCTVTQVKTRESDGYRAVQLGYGQAKHLSKPLAGHLKAAKVQSRTLREVRLVDITLGDDEAAAPEVKVGDQLTVAVFAAGDAVQVTATSKGKGFAGTIKRYNFSRGPKTHGSNNYRLPGSIGAGYPEHVFKGQRMAGRMGGERTTVHGLKVVAVDAAASTLAIAGAVPGPRRGSVLVEAE